MSECKQAAADYQQGVRNVPGAIIFTCAGAVGTPGAEERQPASRTPSIDEASLSSALAQSDEMGKVCPTPSQLGPKLPPESTVASIRNLQCDHKGDAIAQYDVDGRPTWGGFNLVYAGGVSYWDYAGDDVCMSNFGFPTRLANIVCGGHITQVHSQ